MIKKYLDGQDDLAELSFNNLRLKLAINYHDLWVGVYWKYYRMPYLNALFLDVYICIVPAVVIQIKKAWSAK